MEKNPDKGYIALLGWSLNAVEAAESFDRRYVVVAPSGSHLCGNGPSLHRARGRPAPLDQS